MTQGTGSASGLRVNGIAILGNWDWDEKQEGAWNLGGCDIKGITRVWVWGDVVGVSTQVKALPGNVWVVVKSCS